MSQTSKNLMEVYKQVVVPGLKSEFGLTNNLAVPRLIKVVINVGLNASKKDTKAQEVVVKTLERITGQKPVLALARKSISNFKIREGMAVGVVVTMRGARMNEFLTKLLRVTFPRVRDFRGLSIKSVDKQGNLSLGFREHTVFPEIKSDEIESLHGLEVVITTNARSQKLGRRLFELLGFPFAN
ncbi:MAG: 50S ribosomal protein L5 [Patescibacteria group bacterium]